MSIYKKLAVLASAAVIAFASMPSAQAGGAAGLGRASAPIYRKMREGTNVVAPFAFIRYCVTNPIACRPSQGDELDWSSNAKSLVVSVNQRVNRTIKPVNDRREEWRSGVTAGDCEDYALTKRDVLLKAGLPASALRMAVAITAKGEGHAVLVVKTTAGDFVLDNRTNRMAAWHETDLTFVKIASAENPRLWRRLL